MEDERWEGKKEQMRCKQTMEGNLDEVSNWKVHPYMQVDEGR